MQGIIIRASMISFQNDFFFFLFFFVYNIINFRTYLNILFRYRSELDNLCKLYKKIINPGQQQVGQSVIIGRRSQPNQITEVATLEL